MVLIWDVWFNIQGLIHQNDENSFKDALNHSEIKKVLIIISVIICSAALVMWLLQLSSSEPSQPVLLYWYDSPYVQLVGVATYILVCCLLLVWVCFLSGKYSGAKFCAQLLPLYHKKSLFPIPDAPIFRSELFYKILIAVIVLLALAKLAFGLWLFTELGVKPS